MWNAETACGQWMHMLGEALYAGCKTQLAPQITSYDSKHLELQTSNKEPAHLEDSFSEANCQVSTAALSEFTAAAQYFQQDSSTNLLKTSAPSQKQVFQEHSAVYHSLGYARILGAVKWTPSGYLASNEFVDYAQHGFKAKLSYQEARNIIEQGLNTHCVGIQTLQEECLSYLENLNRLHVAAEKLYKLTQPQFIYQGKTLQELMREFKDHYAFETVFLIPMPLDI